MHSTYELQIGQFTEQSVSNKNILNNISDRSITGSIMCDSIVYHMEKKYLCDQDVESFIDIFGTSPCKVATEKGLELLVLDRKNISHVGDVDRFASFVQNVTELDLSWNKIKSWSTVSTLLETMPSLKMLNLSYNPIEKPLSNCDLPSCFNIDEEVKNEDFLVDLKESYTIEQDNGNSCSPPSTSSSILSTAENNSLSMLVIHQNARRVTPKLSTVILNGVNLSLQSIQQFVSTFPKLNELHLAKNTFDPNEIAAIDTFSPFSASVRVLNLNACKLTEWSTVLRLLKCFPNTAYLFLGDNKLEHIEVDCNGLYTEQVCWALQSITLSGNNLKTWKSIENLSFMRRLEELRVRNIPLFNECAEEERHHLIIGRLRSLTSLNGSTITPLQREESERFFIRYYQNSNEKPIVYPELVAMHGNLEQLVKIDLTPRRFAKVVLRCDETNYSATVRIRLSGTVMELMKYAEKITRISTPKMRLFYFDVNVSGCGPTELRFPNQVLQSLHIEDGDEFFIQVIIY